VSCGARGFEIDSTNSRRKSMGKGLGDRLYKLEKKEHTSKIFFGNSQKQPFEMLNHWSCCCYNYYCYSPMRFFSPGLVLCLARGSSILSSAS
jgi:hypothetical protein